MADWRDEYTAMLADCRQRFEALDEWEQAFVDSLGRQFDRPLFVPSPKQVEKLEAVWERAVAAVPAATGNADLFGEG